MGKRCANCFFSYLFRAPVTIVPKRFCRFNPKVEEVQDSHCCGHWKARP